MKSISKAFKTSLLALLAFGAPGVPQAGLSEGQPARYIAHEWGTFTSLQGSNGVNQPGLDLEGLPYEEETLPSFVHSRGSLTAKGMERPESHPKPRSTHSTFQNQSTPSFASYNLLKTTQKMETPVLYFYSDAPQTQKVHLEIDFPQGIISQYYPAPLQFSPPLGQVSALTGGQVIFDLEILSADESNQAIKALPEVPEESIYFPARQTASNLIRTPRGEVEKFIFYRGLGDFHTKLRVTSSGEALDLSQSGEEEIPEVFLLYVGGTKGSFKKLGKIAPHSKVSVSEETVQTLKQKTEPMESFLPNVSENLTKALVDSGLRTDEASAMVNTWKHSYFQTPGLRVLYILSKQETDSLLPLRLTPAPTELIRTLVGRIEVFTEKEEKTLLRELEASLATGQATLPATLSPSTRFSKAKLQRLNELTTHQELKQWLETQFNTLSWE